MNISSDEVIMNSVSGMNYVRPPTLEFITKKQTKHYTEYEVMTKKKSKEKAPNIPGCPENPFVNSVDSFIYCNDSIRIKMPTKEFMIKKNGEKKFAYAVGMFPNPKNKKAAYLDGCILAALGLKRQGTNADVICFITHDISTSDKEKLEVVFDKVMYVPYISPYDMGGEGDLKTIMMDPELFNNCPNYTKNHPYVHVFFKLHIFNPDLFPYEKVCFVDSDLVPMNYYDSLFMLDCPAGFVEYRKKSPYLESYQWDRCDYLTHGKPIPKEITDIDKPSGADVNAGLLLVKPDKKEYNAMIKELTSPLKTWMGKHKHHKGFWSFNFDNPDGIEFIENSYCYPEQNYLTKRYSGKWKFIEFAFQSWALDPCNSFGIHMAAFNPKPWFKQPVAANVDIDEKYLPYAKSRSKKNIRIPIALKENTRDNYENISFSYEMFNEVIIWGMVNFPELHEFFVHNTQIHGTKVSFDSDVFKKLETNGKQYKLLKNIDKKDKSYRKLSLSQKYISDLINDFDKSSKKIKDKYLQVCRTKRQGKNNYDYDFTILTYPNHTDLSENDKIRLLKEKKMPFGKHKSTPIKDLEKSYVKWFITSTAYKKDKNLRKVFQEVHKDFIKDINKKKTKKKSLKGGRRRTNHKTKKKKNVSKKNVSKKNELIYFTMDGCPWCEKFNPTWKQLKKSYGNKLNMIKINRQQHPELVEEFGVQSFPTIILHKQHRIPFEGERDIQTFEAFLKKNKVI
jgi:thiol-disulfide isomerase/thioredoxin